MALSQANYDPAMRMGARTGHFSPGGTVTQATNRSTGVTINSLSGAITTNTTSLAAGASASFVVTNNQVFADDVVVVSIASGATNSAGVAGTTSIVVTAVAAGSFRISVQNSSSTTAEVGAIVINFLVMKASATS